MWTPFVFPSIGKKQGDPFLVRVPSKETSSCLLRWYVASSRKVSLVVGRESAGTSTLVPRLLDIRVKRRVDQRIVWINFESYDRRRISRWRTTIEVSSKINDGSISTSIERYMILFEPRGIDDLIFERCPCVEVPAEFCETSQLLKTFGLPVSVASENYDRFRETFPKNVPQFRMFPKYNIF